MDLTKIEKANTQLIGKKIEYYKTIESTHLYAKQIAKNPKNNGKIILAEIQTAGIGTKGRSWYTGEGKNIAMTIILHPNCSVRKLDGISLKIAKIIKKSIFKLYGFDLKIKEPNDLMLNGKKICGILTEINTSGEKVNYLLISFGFNVNEDKFSEKTKDIATSLKKEYNKDFIREEIIKEIIENLEIEL